LNKAKDEVKKIVTSAKAEKNSEPKETGVGIYSGNGFLKTELLSPY
jgi:hypothetical protein